MSRHFASAALIMFFCKSILKQMLQLQQQVVCRTPPKAGRESPSCLLKKPPLVEPLPLSTPICQGGRMARRAFDCTFLARSNDFPWICLLREFGGSAIADSHYLRIPTSEKLVRKMMPDPDLQPQQPGCILVQSNVLGSYVSRLAGGGKGCCLMWVL